jgi:putative transcriptional regulator
MGRNRLERFGKAMAMLDVGPGKLLIAVPTLNDPNFFRTVVLLFQQSDEGTAGVILNRRTDKRISNLGDEFANHSAETDHAVYYGGPIAGPLLALHTSLSLGEFSVVPGLFVSTNRDNLLALSRQNKHRCRFFAHYSGWGPEQLAEEISAGGWLLAPGDLELVFSDEQTIWRRICESLGHDIMLDPRFRNRMPDQPGLN